MKIIVTGATGQVGHDIVIQARREGYEVIGLSSSDLDISQKFDVEKFIKQNDPDLIIHCAAYTFVDNAEDEKEKARAINVKGTKYIAEAAKAVNAKLIYISTDYVFNGLNLINSEADKPDPVNYYGLTKYEGELEVQRLVPEHYIVRISWVFGKNGNNFVKTMLNLAYKYKEINVVSDQIGSPTYTRDLAVVLMKILKSNNYGIYHITNEGYCNWAEFAEEIFKNKEMTVKVNHITTEDYPTKAVRPKNSMLKKDNLHKYGFGSLPNWQDALRRYLQEINDEVK